MLCVLFKYQTQEKSMKSLNKIASVAAVAVMVVLATGCNRKGANTTAGEKVDNTIAASKDASSDVGNHVENTTHKAGQAVDDAAITASIKSKLIADNELKAIDINVDTSKGVVTLTGAAPNAKAVERATTIARATDGVSDVKNNLTTN